MLTDSRRPSRAPQLVLATDLDGTFLGGDDHDRTQLYNDLIERRDEVTLVFVTGRDLDFVAELIEQPGMPRPDVIIGDVGTTVVSGNGFTPIEPVQSWIDTRWNGANERVVELLDGHPGLTLQPVMGPRRVSYFYEPAVLERETIKVVEEAGFDVVLSADVFFDVLPKGVAKGPTLTRLIDTLDLPDERVLVAGDTMNDLSLFHTGLKGVAVGNSEARLFDAVADLPDVYCSERHGCGGITEAIQHFGLVPAPA